MVAARGVRASTPLPRTPRARYAPAPMADAERSKNCLEHEIEGDLVSGRCAGVKTRFPPEPNGYLHVGHAKAICISFGLAQQYGGTTNLRFDDTNPSKEDQEYVDAIKRDIEWLGFRWAAELYASDYFEQLYEWAVQLIRQGDAYVCDCTPEQVSANRGVPTRPGTRCAHRERPVAENLDLFARMRAGEVPDGARTLRARIDMDSPNLNLRDPVCYRIQHAHHHRTGDAWCCYPMYDYAHGQSDSIERITHSLCSLEFENHRPLYEWFIQKLGIYAPRQIEFARLSLTYTVMSKRLLLELVQGRHVDGWDDPRMPTISGMRRRGYPPSAIRTFCDKIGVAKADSTVDVKLLEFCVREQLNRTAPRRMAVLRPLKLTITNWPAGHVDEVELQNNPEDPAAGTRRVPFTGALWVERDDFREEAPKKWYRLAPGREVRLRGGYFVTVADVVKDAAGTVTELRCTYDPATRGGDAPDGRKVRGTIHWVSAAHAVAAEVRLYEHLFTAEDPMAAAPGGDFVKVLNPASCEVLADCRVEPSVATAEPGSRWQFERLGYFCRDTRHAGRLVFNRTLTLRDSWAKIEQKGVAGE